MKSNKNRKKALEYFHKEPWKMNCAQAILKGFQQEFGISDLEIEEYKAWGGGRAEGGVCGTVFAARRLVNPLGNMNVDEEFKKVNGTIYCKELKGSKIPCTRCVAVADELVEKAFLDFQKNRK